MSRPERTFHGPIVHPATSGGAGPAGMPEHPDDKAAALRRIERERRLIHRASPNGVLLPTPLLGHITCGSFRLENLSITERQVSDALACGAGRRAFRPPQLLRIRNHVAILRHIQKAARDAQELKLPAVLRWYTSFSCGLSMGLDVARTGRLEQCLRRINAPRLRLQQAVADIAEVYLQLTADPIFPGFNGILARLLLQYHLARCRLPFVAFASGPPRPGASFEATLLDMISEAHALRLHPPR